MRVLSIDWADKKALKVFDSQAKKVKEVSNTIEEIEKFITSLKDKAIMLFEFGGGDVIKIMAFREDHKVLQVPGKKVHDFRDKQGIKKNDEIDARLIYEFYQLEPESFYEFRESDAEISELKVLFREHEDLKKQMVREKNKRIAFERKFKLARVADDRIKKMLFHKDTAIVAREKDVELIKKVLEKKVEQFPIWDKYLKGIKAVGPVIASGLIGELGNKQFNGESGIKHYAGMVAKNDFHDYNRYLKVVLFQFAEGVIKHKTPIWRELYDNMKEYYQEKHEDWSKGKVNNYAKKFIETKFLLEFYEKWLELK